MQQLAPLKEDINNKKSIVNYFLLILTFAFKKYINNMINPKIPHIIQKIFIPFTLKIVSTKMLELQKGSKGFTS